MTQTTDSRERFVRDFSHFENSLNGRASCPVHRLRRQAMEHFASAGFPTLRDEEWRYTDLGPIVRVPFTPVLQPPHAPPRAALAPYLYDQLPGPQLVFVDGHFMPHLSRLATLPDGLLVTSLAAAVNEHAEELEPHLARHAQYQNEPFTALNTAFIRDGAFVRVQHDTAVPEPIQVVFFSTGAGGLTVSYPRVLVLADEHAQLTVLETYAGKPDTVYLTNTVAEIVLRSGAHVDHYQIHRESDAAFHFSDLHVLEESNAHFRSTCITLNGRVTRNHVHTVLGGEGIDSTLNGLHVTSGSQHVDTNTLVEHRSPNCGSHEYYKGVMDDSSTGSFRGKILVHQMAQKTDAYQANRNLLLSETADVSTMPQLEIYADDVKCSHGATVGQLEADAIFYLQSRGIGLQQARRILTQAFAAEILERVLVEPVQQHLSTLVIERLSGARP